MAEGDACLLDSNILLRISKRDDPHHPVIAQALKTLVGQGVRLCYTSQTLAEFWNASTRPLDKNGFGLSIAETDRLARVIERDFELLPDSRETHERWRAPGSRKRLGPINGSGLSTRLWEAKASKLCCFSACRRFFRSVS